MIKDNFYPDSLSYGESVFTDTWGNLSGSDISAPYLMGYVPKSAVPESAYFSLRNRDDDYVYFNRISEETNLGWGFSAWPSDTTTASANWAAMRISGNWSENNVFENYTPRRFLNRMDIRQVGNIVSSLLMCCIRIDSTDSEDEHIITGDYKSDNDVLDVFGSDDIVSALYRFCRKSGETYTFTLSDGSNSNSFEISSSDFDSHGICRKSLDGTDYMIFFSYADFRTFRDYYSETAAGGYSNILPFLRIDNLYSGEVYPCVSALGHCGFSGGRQRMAFQPGNFALYDWMAFNMPDDETIVGGGLNGQYPRTVHSEHSNVLYYHPDCNFIVYSAGNWSQYNYLIRIVKPSEIANLMNLLPRIQTDGGYGFGETAYVPLYSKQDSPLNKIISGEIEDISGQLRSWQHEGDITLDAFGTADIPALSQNYYRFSFAVLNGVNFDFSIEDGETL